MVIPHRKPNRLKKYDYSDAGWYFVTICTQNRECLFGNVINNKMVLNKFGEIIDKCWTEIPNHINNVELNEYIIMPNHVHGIIVIRNSNQPVGNAYMRSLQTDHWQYRTKMLLSIIMHEFKSAVSRYIRKYNSLFQWQKSFYDHIIRNENDLNRIRQYIRDNPMNWNDDRNNIFDE